MVLLITGATGFIGRHLLQTAKKEFCKTDNRVIALTSREIEDYKCIIHKDYQFLKEDFEKNGIHHIDAVIHLGGYSPKNRAEMNRIDDYLSSIRNTNYLLTHLPNIPDQIIFCSTISVYKERTGEVISEDTVPEPQTLYGAYKFFCEKLVDSWAKENHTVSKIIRLGNVYGPGEDRYAYMIPLMIQQALRGERITLYVSPNIRRNYVYVEDVCRMLINALSIDGDIGPINLVSGSNHTMGEIVDAIVKAVGNGAKWSVADKLEENDDILFDKSKVACFLGKEMVSLEKGIAWEVEYFKNKYNYTVHFS